MERKLLYYDRFQRMPRHYDGAPIFHFLFKDVKTGEDVTIGSCFFAEEASDILGGVYYEDIVEAEKDYDILWNLSDDRIRPVVETFEEVENEYQRMLKDGVSEKEVNSEMIKFFEEKRVSRILR